MTKNEETKKALVLTAQVLVPVVLPGTAVVPLISTFTQIAAQPMVKRVQEVQLAQQPQAPKPPDATEIQLNINHQHEVEQNNIRQANAQIQQENDELNRQTQQIERIRIQTEATRKSEIERQRREGTLIVDTLTQAELIEMFQEEQDPRSHVVEFRTLKDSNWVRVHGSTNQHGGWIMRKSSIQGLTPEQIQLKFALPNKPTHISDVKVPAGTSMVRGNVQYHQMSPSMPVSAPSGAIQYKLEQRIDLNFYTNVRSLPEVFQ